MGVYFTYYSTPNSFGSIGADVVPHLRLPGLVHMLTHSNTSTEPVDKSNLRLDVAPTSKEQRPNLYVWAGRKKD